MGGGESRFKATQWSCILSARTTDETRRRMILENLTKTYWKPIYCYILRKGFGNEKAKDLTQDFFAEIVLGRDLIQNADQAKGKFRTLLLVALERFIVSSLRHDGRIRRGGDAHTVHLDGLGLENCDIPGFIPGADEAFYYTWITDLLDQVLIEVKKEYSSTQRESHWEAFRLKLLEPLLHGAEALPVIEICRLYDIDSEKRASNMIETVKRRFRSVLKRRLRDLTDSEDAAEQEFRDIFNFLARYGAE